jgi:hypothetical protein
MVCMLAASVLLAGLWYLGRAVTKARRAALNSSTQGPLNQVLMALHNYHAEYGCLPPAYIADKDGKPMHSWRVLILPYLDESALYQAYRFDEPWDSAHNLSLADSMPRSFLARTEPASRRYTNIVVIVGPSTAFPGGTSTTFDDFKDGTDNTILVTEIANSDICWLEPRDLDSATMSFKTNDRKKPSISSVGWRRPYVVLAHSIHAYPVPEDTPPEALRALTTIAGGEATSRDTIWPGTP